MKIEQFEKAKELLDDLARVKEIKSAMQEESSHWWAFISPDTKRRSDGDGLRLPDILRDEFEKAVELSIQKLTEEIEKL